MTIEMNEGFIYRISAPSSNSVYVGQSINPQKRFKQHKSSRQNPALSSFLKKHADAIMYSWPVFNMNSEEIEEEKLCRDMGFNLLNCFPCGGPSVRGRTLTPEHRAKIGRANSGRTLTEEHRAKIGLANRGKGASTEHLVKLAANHRGKRFTDEHRRKLSIANRGKTLSVEHRAKISSALLGRVRSPHTAESIAKMSAALLGRKLTSEHRARLSEAKTGKQWSPARRAAHERKVG